MTCEKDNFCTYSEGKKIVKCTDTDGGVNLYTKGKITLYDENDKEYVIFSLFQAYQESKLTTPFYEDVCIDDKQLWEFTCNPRDIEDAYTCLNGCKNGACIK